MKNLIAVVTCILFFACDSKTTVQDTAPIEEQNTAPFMDCGDCRSTPIFYVRVKKEYLKEFLESVSIGNIEEYLGRSAHLNTETDLEVVYDYKERAKYIYYNTMYASIPRRFDEIEKFVYIVK